MKRSFFHLGTMSFLIACGGSSDSLKSKALEPLTQTEAVERVEVSRASEVIKKKEAELQVEKKVPFHTFLGLKTLLSEIQDKLFEDEKFSNIEEQLWLALDSLSLKSEREKKNLKISSEVKR